MADKTRLDKKQKIELRMRRILCTGVAVGLVLGIAFSSLVSGVVRGKDTPEAENTKQETNQSTDTETNNPTVEMQVTDAEEVGRMNAQTLAADSDDWMLTLINASYPLATDYAPTLVTVEDDKQVDERILTDLQQMLSDARAEGLNPYICSAYRDYAYQRTVFNDTMLTWLGNGYAPLDAYDETAKSVAIPGTSEHATGLALDITSAEFPELDERQADTAEAKWLAENCWKYGFILRYPSDKSDVTGIVYEPWHYRYVGEKAAQEITEQGITLEEYLGK